MAVESRAPHGDAVAFAERLLTLLDEGSFTTTYKQAVLLGLMDLCMEGATRSGAAPSSVTTHQLAEKVLELYWPHARDFSPERPVVLRQGHRTRGGGGQPKIVQSIVEFRARHAPDPSAPLSRARAHAPAAYHRLLRQVEWSLVEWPLPRVQVIGRRLDPFIYEIGWEQGIRKREFDDPETFHNVIRFVGDAAEHLVRLAGLLRPLIQKHWATKVASLNRAVVPEAELEDFLFGVERVNTAAVRAPLRELQDNRCFYCGDRIRRAAEVDHFIPWARHPDNGIENLVIADGRCNNSKRDHIAAASHLGGWVERIARHAADLEEISARTACDRHPERTLGAARSIYHRLPNDALLWLSTAEFVPAEPPRIAAALALLHPAQGSRF